MSEEAYQSALRVINTVRRRDVALDLSGHGESGRRGAAVQLYRTLADALRTELGAQPEAETRAVFAEIARGGEARPRAKFTVIADMLAAAAAPTPTVRQRLLAGLRR